MIIATNPFEGPRLKVSRARDQLNRLVEVEREFFATSEARIGIEIDPASGDRLAKVFVDASPPAEAHVLIGEVIYNLRSSLDQMAVAAARLSNDKPNVKKVYFPTGDSLAQYNAKSAQCLIGFDQDLAEVIYNCLAYDGGNDALRSLFRIANVDKHLELVAIGSFGGMSGLSHYRVSNANCGFMMGLTGDLAKGVAISDLGEFGTIEPINEQATLHVSGCFEIGEPTIFHGESLLPFLATTFNETAAVYRKLLELCMDSGRIPRPA